MPAEAPSALQPHPKRFATVDGTRMAYVEVGEGDPIVLLHGNPTSSYLWRNVLPHLAPLGRCLAPDLVGMGDSDKLDPAGPGAYTFGEHARHLDGLLDELGVTSDVTLVLHDWGSALGFHWANRHRGAVRAIAYMEAIVRPVTWEEWPVPRATVEALRSPAGESMVLDGNLFVDKVLPRSVLRQLTEAEMAEYRRPFLEAGESRRPTLSWARQAPVGDAPAEVIAAVTAYGDWLARSSVPKLLVVAEPGALLVGGPLEFCRRWPNQREVTVPGLHFLQEDSPAAIGTAIAAWLGELAGGDGPCPSA